jgi:hypothetical protein
LAETVNVVLVVPLPGAADSQFPPDVVAADAVKLTLPFVLVTDKVCGAGFAPPVSLAKLSATGNTDSTGCGATLRVTGTSTGLLVAPADASVIAPVYWPAAKPVKIPATTDAVTPAGVVALPGATESQLPPLTVEAVAV